MREESKQTLISLSLAGAIGYYLYNKLVQAGIGPQMARSNEESIEERTQRELSWRPNFVSEEPSVADDTTDETTNFESVENALVDSEPVVETHIPETHTFTQENIFVDEVTPVNSDVLENTENVSTVEPPEIEKIAKDEEVDENDNCVATPPFGSVEDVGIDVTRKNFENLEPNVQIPSLDAQPVVGDLEYNPLAVPLFDLEAPFAEESPTKAVESQQVPVIEQIDTNEIDANGKETSVDDLFDAINGDDNKIINPELVDPKAEEVVSEQSIVEEPKTMDNVEPLHKVDQKDESAKEEFKSIMDFFNTL